MSFVLPPIVKLAERLLLEIEHAVRSFARCNKFGYGSDLRKQAMEVALLAHRAWRDRANQAKTIGELVAAVDDLKLRLQIGSRLHAFASFGQFEQLARTASDLGRQTGGWNRQQNPKGQSDRRASAGQRAQILSSPATSFEVNS